MKTSIYLDKRDIINLNNKYNDNSLKEFRMKLETQDLSNIPMKIFDNVESKKLVGIFLNLELWKKLNYWIISQTTETQKPTLRDAMLTLLEM